MNQPTLSKLVCVLFAFCAATAIAAPAQVLTTLHSFAAPWEGWDYPGAGLVQGSDGNFYGTTYQGGAYKDGTVFKITPSGALTTLYSFCSQTNCSDGANPIAGLVLANDGNFYGTTVVGGANCSFQDGCGSVFKITLSGVLTTLHSFDYGDGAYPYAGLVEGRDGNFYGTTPYGGAYNNSGTVFKITPSGTLTTLYSFCSEGWPCPDGYYPYAGLVEGRDGNFYGTTTYGGTIQEYCNAGCGTVFKITPNGTLTTLHTFGYGDGVNPHAALLQASDGNFYGTTYQGGAYNDGTVFKITPSGALTTLYSFCSQTNCSDGANPIAGLVLANDGNFYGTASGGGANYDGTVFKITPSGALNTLYSFCSQTNCSDGANPHAGLVQATDGNFYGTTFNGGTNCSPYGCGTVFRLVTLRACIVCPSVE